MAKIAAERIRHLELARFVMRRPPIGGSARRGPKGPMAHP